MADENPRLLGGFEYAPDVAKELGRYLGQISIFEVALSALLKNFASIPDQKSATAIFGSISSVATRISILEQLVPIRFFDDPEMAREVDAILARAKDINARRNAYVHSGYWVSLSDGAVDMESWIASSRKSKTETISDETVAQDTQAVRTFMYDLVELIAPETARKGETFEPPPF